MGRILALAGAAALLLALLWWGSALFRRDRATPGTAAQATDPVAPTLSTPEIELKAGDVEPADERVHVESIPRRAEAPGTTDPEATTGALSILCVLEDDEPLPRVGVVVEPRGPMGRNVRRVVADAEGRVRVAGLPPGETSLWSHHGAWDEAEVVAGEEHEVRLEFPAGVAVRGIVVDAREEPVAGAEVWLAAWRRDWQGTSLLATTGSDGSFEAPYVGLERSLGATASGHGPSELTDLSQLDAARPPVALRLQLTSAGGDLQGRVLDPDGQAVSGARVAVGKSPRDWSTRQDGSDEEQWTARVGISGADGTYRIEGLGAARHPVHVLAAAYPILGTEVEILEGDVTTLDLQLERGLQVVGVVRDEDGAPIEEAVVLALDAPFDDPFPTQGPTEVGVPFRRPGVRSEPDGSFVLGWMPAGDVYLYSSKGISFWDGPGVEYLGTVQETLSGSPGETLSWDPVLARGWRIHGQVLYADGEPMGNVFVSAIEQDDSDKQYTEDTNEEGRFSIPGLKNQAYRVSVQLWDAPDDVEALEQKDVWPSANELKLYASYSKSTAEKGTVRVRVEDEAERVEGSVMVMLQHDLGAHYTEEQDGVHEAELPPGRYRPVIHAGDTVVGGGDWFDLEPGEILDLGTIPTSFAGSLTVHVIHGEGPEPARMWLLVKSRYARQQEGVELEKGQYSVTFEDLLTDEIVVWLQGTDIADVRREVTIQRDVLAELTLETVPAVVQRFEFTAEKKGGWGTLDIVVTDERGAVYAEVKARERWAGELPYETSLRMPVGRFRVEAKTTSGLTFQGEIEIEFLAEREPSSCKLE
jgi:hypothetical protein